MPVTLATKEAETRRIMVQNFAKLYLENTPHT
jgi:hypothetical protein